MALNLRRRTAGLLVGAALSAAALTACGVPASTVATIGDETITQKEYTSALDAAYADPIVGEQVADLGSAYRISSLNDLVTYEIAKAVAENADVSITDSEIDAKLEELLGGQSLEDVQQQMSTQGDPVTADQLRMRVARGLVTAKFGEQVTGQTQDELAAEQLTQLKAQRDANPAQYTSYSLALTVTADQALANDWITKANGGMTLQDAVASNPDPNAPAGTPPVVEDSISGADLAQEPALLQQLQAIPVGQTGSIVQGPDQMGAFTFVVVTVTAATPASDADLQTQAASAAEQQFLTAGMTESANQAQSIDVELNPRYGTLEYPEQGLPSVTAPTPDTFSGPSEDVPVPPTGL